MNKKRLVDYGLGLLLVAGSATGTAQAKVQVGAKPNALYIIMDDMNDWAQYLGGNVQAKTPNLDRLAARGVHFSNAYAAVPLCNPSRTSMFTGMQPFVTGVYNNKQVLADSPIANNSLMMPQHFSTVHFSQWNLIQYADGSRELYDVENDENEFRNLAGKPEYKVIVDSLVSYVPESWHSGIKPTPNNRRLPARRKNPIQHINE